MSKNKKKGSKKSDKKDKKKSKSSSFLKGKDKKHGKKDKHHEKKGSHAKGPKGHHAPKPKKHAPGHGGGEMIARTPPADAAGNWAQPGRPPMQKGHPGGAPPYPPQQRMQHQPGQGPPQQQQQQQRPQQPPPGQGAPGKPPGGRSHSQTLSAESIGMGGGLQQQPQQQQKRPQQQQPQQAAAGPPRPSAAPPAARPPPQQQQQRAQPVQQQPQQSSPQGQRTPQQPSPDMEKTEKKSSKKSGSGGNKISRFLDIKFSSVVDNHRKNIGTLPNSVSRAAFDDNLCLNRFEDVICIDQTRVLFSDSSLYLNANWVVIEPGKKPEDPPKKMAIVAQLPLPECAVAFWTMIAENDIKGVLLFADDNEFLTFGADKILPMNKSTVQISPRITVTHTHRVAVSTEWSMHVYLMCRGDVRKYLHVHVYAWPGDEQIKLSALWQLESVFRKYAFPHVYMSSAGIGRASTFAALNMVHARMHDESCKEVNLNSCIVSLREHRLHSIQSAKQSITLHSALIQHIIDSPAFEKLEQDNRVRSFAEQFKEFMANDKD